MSDDQKTADVVAALNSQPQIARMFLALWSGRGRGLTYTHLAERIRDMSGGDRPSVDTVRGLASRLARAMRERGWPATITNLPTLGYRLDAPRGWDPFQETDMTEEQSPLTILRRVDSQRIEKALPVVVRDKAQIGVVLYPEYMREMDRVTVTRAGGAPVECFLLPVHLVTGVLPTAPIPDGVEQPGGQIEPDTLAGDAGAMG